MRTPKVQNMTFTLWKYEFSYRYMYWTIVHCKVWIKDSYPFDYLELSFSIIKTLIKNTLEFAGLQQFQRICPNYIYCAIRCMNVILPFVEFLDFERPWTLNMLVTWNTFLSKFVADMMGPINSYFYAKIRIQ